MSDPDLRTAPRPNPPRYTPPKSEAWSMGVIAAGVLIALLLLGGTIYTMSQATTTAQAPSASTTTTGQSTGTGPNEPNTGPSSDDAAPPPQMRK